jgi:hypothetical protein
MKLSAPKIGVFYVAAILAVIAIVAAVLAIVASVTIPFVTVYSFWILTIAFVLLAAGVCLKGF